MYKVIIIGNLGGRPEGKYTQDGRYLCTFNLATTRMVKGEKLTNWTRVTVWGEYANTCVKWLDKGSKVCVMGRPEAHAWTDNTGTTRASLEVTADEVEFIHIKKDGMSETDEQAPFED